MIFKNILPRALERLAVIEAGAPVREAAALMSKPHTDSSSCAIMATWSVF